MIRRRKMVVVSSCAQSTAWRASPGATWAPSGPSSSPAAPPSWTRRRAAAAARHHRRRSQNLWRDRNGTLCGSEFVCFESRPTLTAARGFDGLLQVLELQVQLLTSQDRVGPGAVGAHDLLIHTPQHVLAPTRTNRFFLSNAPSWTASTFRKRPRKRQWSGRGPPASCRAPSSAPLRASGCAGPACPQWRRCRWRQWSGPPVDER